MNKLNYLLVILLLPITFCLAQKDASLKEKLDKVTKLQQETFELPGMAVGIIKNNEIIYTNALGVQALDNNSPLTQKSLFHMASVSKPFVATAIMQLVEQGKLDLDKRIVDYLPYFKMKDKNYQKITLRQVLTHSSGIPDVEDYEWDKPQYDDQAAERYTKSFTRVDLDFKPGKDFNYSNAAFDIMADVISKVSGMTFEAYMTKYIFEPAGMKNSTFYKPDVPTEIATKPHVIGDDLQIKVMDGYPYNRIHAPSSTLHSNIEDMLQWAMVNLNEGEINGNRIFSPATYKLLTTPNRQLSDEFSICLSWFLQEKEDLKIYYHSGGDEGYSTFFGFFPDKKAAVFVMGNNDFFDGSGVAIHLAKNFIYDQPNPWKKLIHFELKNRILTEGIEACKAFYYNAQKEQADKYNFSPGYMDELGYGLMGKKYLQEALDIFLFNVELNPEEAGFYDSVADAYRAMGNKAKAIEWYEKALELNPKQDFSKKKLKALKKEK